MDYSKIKPDTREALDEYGQGALPSVGSFLFAVLSNNLVEAFRRADDGNAAAMQEIVAYCYNKLPSECWGSKEKVEAWLENAGTNHAFLAGPGAVINGVPGDKVQLGPRPAVRSLWEPGTQPSEVREVGPLLEMPLPKERYTLDGRPIEVTKVGLNFAEYDYLDCNPHSRLETGSLSAALWIQRTGEGRLRRKV
jgi:hypothetical protein